nr:exodeoxyribonuclease VII small subunit [Myxococcota bacterium]
MSQRAKSQSTDPDGNAAASAEASVEKSAADPADSREKSAADPADSAETVSFEELVRRLEEAVRKLEGGELPLDESLAVFEEGVRLARAGTSRLDEVE